MSSQIQALRAKNATALFPGQHAVVVGGTSGIGLGIAKRLATTQFNVTIVGRNTQRGNEIVTELAALNPNGKHRFIPCDATLLSNVKKTCETLPPVDRLVLTQGMATIQGRTETAEGIDQKLSLHYYSRMTFIKGLLPELQKQPSPRVLSVLSAGVHGAYEKYKEDPELKENYSLKNAADAAGFYNDVMLDQFAIENKHILFAHAAPGFVNTNWGTEMPWAIRQLLKPLKVFAKSPEDCAEAMCDVLLQSNAEVNAEKGRVVLIDENGGEAAANKHATPEAREFIFKHTLARIWS
ncbi:UNVERIFIED_CONTAM: hypothetical protein HDU68_003963 [Siphonaria sp. JEL0065]|nr:hypothetical protein HDU68_003963 [Siphonaria sp. JEL0065]